VYTIHFEPIGRQVHYTKEQTVLEAAQEAGVEILALCGGLGSCGRCRVRVQGEKLPPLTEKERELLTAEEIEAGYRLACRTPVAHDVVVYVPATSRARAQRLQTAGLERPVECCPPVWKVALTVPPATLRDTRADLRRIEEALPQAWARVDRTALPRVGPALRAGDWQATLTVREDETQELLAVEPGDTTERVHGVAIDLGSTKIALYLVDLTTGRTLEARGVPNPQVAYGEDILTRINYTIDHAEGTQRLRGTVLETLNEAIHALCADHGLSTDDVLELTLVGNTAMHHIFLGLDTEQLARSPCVPSVTRPLALKARELGLAAAPAAYVYLPPAIAGFVGSDHVAMVLATQLHTHAAPCLGIDIGTNTEISLKHGDRIWAVSCASGPAFEGAAICWGMKAAPGAIESVWIDPQTQAVQIATIDDAPPVGLCGSGILDCVAAMRSAGMVEPRGRIRPEARGVRPGENGLPELVLAETEGGQQITVTQEDVQRIQLAKGAIRSGIEVLLDAAGLEAPALDRVILAGAFGTYIDPLSAMEIGMLPTLEPERIVQVGNAAGVGAKETLISTALRREAERIARTVEYLELTVYPRYSRFFAHALRF
jgi:uncharacterized 2Fe-2S/4Fe-4S cluster protein (DUF4445 family)